MINLGYALSPLVAFVIARVVYTLYRWNFVMLRGLDGPRSKSFLYGHVGHIHLDECSTFWYNWERMQVFIHIKQPHGLINNEIYNQIWSCIAYSRILYRKFYMVIVIEVTSASESITLGAYTRFDRSQGRFTRVDS